MVMILLSYFHNLFILKNRDVIHKVEGSMNFTYIYICICVTTTTQVETEPFELPLGSLCPFHSPTRGSH